MTAVNLALITLAHNAADLPVTAAIGTDTTTIDLTFDSTTFAVGDTLTITIPADAVKDGSANNNLEMKTIISAQ